MKKDFYIRKANRKDSLLILQLITLFAKENNLDVQLKVNQNLLEKFLFNRSSHAKVILGYMDATPISYALYTFTYSTLLGKPTLYLIDIFVKSEYRDKKVGKKMLKFLSKIATDKECGRIEWSVLKNNTSAIGFYNHIKAKPLTDWVTYRLTEDLFDF